MKGATAHAFYTYRRLTSKGYNITNNHALLHFFTGDNYISQGHNLFAYHVFFILLHFQSKIGYHSI